VISRRAMASVAGAAGLLLAVASWAPALATEPRALGGASVGGPGMVAPSAASSTVPHTPPPKQTLAPGQTPTASPIPTPAPAASQIPITAATQSPQPGSQGGGSTNSVIPIVLGGILVLGLLAGILTFVLLGRRRVGG
jgi:hypothetical protein